MKKITATLLLLVTIFTMMSARVSKPIKGWKTYETNYYKIQYPPDWKIDTSEEHSSEKVSIISPKVDGGEVILLVDRAAPETVLTLDHAVSQIESMYRDTIKMSEGWITTNHIEESIGKNVKGVEYHSITTSHTSNRSHKSNSYKWETKEYIFVKKNVAYNINYAAEQTGYSKSIKTVDKIMDSFRLK